MTEAETHTALTGVFRDVFDDDALTIHAGTTADDIPGWDSQANIILIVATEQHFNISFRTAEIESLHNVGEFIQLIQSKQAVSNRQ
jgi:acyl carrier protein